jgi:hypothetical protein
MQLVHFAQSLAGEVEQLVVRIRELVVGRVVGDQVDLTRDDDCLFERDLVHWPPIVERSQRASGPIRAAMIQPKILQDQSAVQKSGANTTESNTARCQ